MSVHGALVGAIRRIRGLTQEDLAEVVGVDTGTVSRWERGVRGLAPETASDLYDGLGLKGATRAKVTHILVDGWRFNPGPQVQKLDVVFRGTDVQDVMDRVEHREAAVKNLVDIFYDEFTSHIGN